MKVGYGVSMGRKGRRGGGKGKLAMLYGAEWGEMEMHKRGEGEKVRHWRRCMGRKINAKSDIREGA